MIQPLRRQLSAVIVISLAASSLLASGQVVDVSEEVAAALRSLGQVRKSRTVSKQIEECYEGCCGRSCENDCTKCC